MNKYIDEEKIKEILFIRPIYLKTFHSNKKPGILGIEIDISTSKYCWIVPINNKLTKFIMYIEGKLYFNIKKKDFIEFEECIHVVNKFTCEVNLLEYLDNNEISNNRKYLKAVKAFDEAKIYSILREFREMSKSLALVDSLIRSISINSRKNTKKLSSNIQLLRAKSHILKDERNYVVIIRNLTISLEINPNNHITLKLLLENIFNYSIEKVVECVSKNNFKNKIDFSRELKVLSKSLEDIDFNNVYTGYLSEVINIIINENNRELIKYTGIMSRSTCELFMDIFEKLLDKIYNLGFSEESLIILNLIVQISQYCGEKRYSAYIRLKNYVDARPDTLIIYGEQLAEMCWEFKDFEDGKRYIDKTLEKFKMFYKENDKKNDKDIKVEIESIKWNLKAILAHIYKQENRFSEAIDIMTEVAKRYPGNTNFHNLGEILVNAKEYKLAKKYIQRALLISEDEKGYMLMANALYFDNKFEESIKYYKRAIAFCGSENTTFIFEDFNERNVISFSNDLTLNYIKKVAYKNIIYAYIELKDYINAIVYYKLATKEFEYEQDFIILNNLLNKLISYEKNEKDILKTFEEVIEKLQKEKQKVDNQLGKVKEWALSLIQAQDRCNEFVNSNFEGKEWIDFEKELQKIAEQMKEIKSKDSLISFIEIEEYFKSRYKNISEKALKFLSTGEYLYKINKDEYVDYAPIMIEYCKVVELELNNYLKKQGVIQKQRMLGNINNLLKNGDFYKITKYLEEIVRYRNESAHTGSVTRDKVKYIRDILFNDGFLEMILDI